ncbi:hypothetical protein LTR64_001157 [Lithohypha guttulata]|uniref:uncharacterized protein n=1 Tax=Lithohypha guttulata TaxID=1690604 RepID=UPI002DDE03BD|nr:hypothetical protein LTR51_003351 [Lithohypha guttulata]
MLQLDTNPILSAGPEPTKRSAMKKGKRPEALERSHLANIKRRRVTFAPGTKPPSQTMSKPRSLSLAVPDTLTSNAQKSAPAQLTVMNAYAAAFMENDPSTRERATASLRHARELLRNTPTLPAEEALPLTHTNSNLFYYGHTSSFTRSQTQEVNAHHAAVYAEWHTGCPYDNIMHERPSTEEVAAERKTCKCFKSSHGITLLSKTLTHGEGAGKFGATCWLCCKEIGYTCTPTLGHYIPQSAESHR